MILAYIDPGTGALLVQSLIAAVVGALVYFRQKVAGWFRWRRGAGDKGASDKGNTDSLKGGK
jgi:hypothetical protein